MSRYLYPYQLQTITFSAGTRQNVSLKELPKRMGDKQMHLVKLQFEIVSFTPTFASNTVPLANAHQIFELEFNDGNGVSRFKGNLNTMRAKERMNTGRNRVPDSDDGATTVARHFTRTLHLGPPQMKGYPGDYAVHTGALENGYISIQHNALGSIDADLSALTATLRVTAFLLPMTEIRIPPAYQFAQEDTGSKSVQLTGRCRYESIYIAKSSSYDAFSAGDIGAVRLDMGQGDIIPSIEAETLRNAFLDDYAAGDIGTVMGEPETATVDDNGKQVNRVSAPTALTGVDADLQPILWTPPGGLLNKLNDAESVCKLSWNGSDSSVTVGYGRFLEQPAAVVAGILAKIVKATGVEPKMGAEVKTLSKKPLPAGSGVNVGFLPWVVKI